MDKVGVEVNGNMFVERAWTIRNMGRGGTFHWPNVQVAVALRCLPLHLCALLLSFLGSWAVGLDWIALVGFLESSTINTLMPPGICSFSHDLATSKIIVGSQDWLPNQI
ncbi:hypothetical protein BU24DRAFT_275299 [Aaosphaeria arxii CBS 175.79]|uniref:Uncharacterized protein n=1 Tax=Aaosphaeria arxii CBS 175.79 TaxID=1450172 RepID=A0A6A5XHM6_9PLEO|nr:uncharacterized protein BU24DRAFT_275299 [Aaosphaeria arxii CBS 175.79]KAF2012356.1 hypothetical protein BU24DRAFT_275299 [Aaosphaeria arxii CBS 175.79]